MKMITNIMIAVCLLGGIVFGQQDGIPNFSVGEHHEYDTINLYSLVPTINIPVLSKNEQIPFSASLTASQYCSLVGAFVSCQGGFSLFSLGLAGTSLKYTSATEERCPNGGDAWTYSGWYLVTSDGLDSHPLLPSVQAVANAPASGSVPAGNCSQIISFTAQTVDNSGYTVNLTNIVGTANGSNPSLSFTVTTKSGLSAVNSGSATSYSETDTFGNTETLTLGSGNTQTYTDALGIASVEMFGNASLSFDTNPHVQYTDTTGTLQNVTLEQSATGVSINLSECAHGASGTIYPITSAQFPDLTSMTFTMEQVQSAFTGRIASFTGREGGSVSYVYPVPCTSLPQQLTRTTADGTTTYSAAESSGGYVVTTVLDPGMNKTVYSFGQTSTNKNAVSANTALTEKDVYQNTGTIQSPSYVLLSKDVFCYNGNQTNCTGAVNVYPITQRDIYHTIGSMTSSSRVSETFDSYGNTTSVSRYGFGASSWTTRTTIAYSGCGQGSTINDRPCSVVTADNASHTLSQSKFTYNSAGFMLSKGVWNGSSFNTTTYSPNTNGTVASATDPNGTVTTYGYAATGSGGCNGLLETSLSVTPASGDTLTASKTWNCNGAVVTGTIDSNSNTTSTSYDPLFRVASSTDESGLTKNFTYTGNSAKVSYAFGAVSYLSTTTTDGYGRGVLSQTADAGEYDTASTSYSVASPYPYTQGSTQTLQSLGSLSPLNSYTYSDALGRSTSTLDADGGTTAITYKGGVNAAGTQAFDTQITIGPAPSNEHVKVSQTEYDGLGRVISTCGSLSSGGAACGQVDGGSGVLTTFLYSFGNGTSMVSASRGSQTHTTVRDGLGRILSVTTPEAGTVQYFWDSAPDCAFPVPGDLIESKSASGIVTCYWYDGLNRLVGYAADHSQPSHTCRVFIYDTPSAYTPPTGVTLNNPKGRMIEAFTNDCNGDAPYTDEWFSYDKNGRVTDVWEMTPHSGGYYHTTAAYYLDGTLNTLSGLPGYSTYTVGLNPNGVPVTASLGSTSLVSNVTWDASHKTKSIVYGTGSSTDSYSYDPTEKMLTYSFATAVATDSGQLSWNADGSLGQLAISDGFDSGGSQTCSYLYDDLNRISGTSTVPGVNCVNGSTNVWNQIFAYDQYDNLTKSGSSTWSPGYNPLNNQIIGASYDSNGNLAYDFQNTYTWDAYGKMASVRSGANQAVCGSSGLCVTYDAFGRAVEKNSSGTYSEILYSPIGRLALMSGATTVTSATYPVPGGSSMTMTGTGGSGRKTINHPDWLGNIRLQTILSGGSMYSDTEYAPYGETYASFGFAPTGPQFTGDFQDLFSGLFDTPNREFDQAAGGRWLSPDPTRAGWNAFSYSTNPNSMVDPAGTNEMPYWSAPWNGPGMYASGGWGQGNCTVDGVSSFCGGMTGLLGGNGTAACPYGACSGLMANGEYFEFVAGAGETQGYIRFSDIVQGINEANGTFYSDSQFQAYLSHTYSSQIAGQYNRVSGNLQTVFGDVASADPDNPNIIGGHANFDLTCDDLTVCGPGRYDYGIHVEYDAGGNLVVHDDTVSPWTSPASFSFSTLFSGSFWEHGFVDLFGGTFCNCVFPR